MSVQQAEPISVSKSVEIMSINGDQPPSEFIVKESQFGSIDTSPPLGPFPVIDISHFSNSSSPEAQLQIENLRSSLSSSGCFQVFSIVTFISFMLPWWELTLSAYGTCFKFTCFEMFVLIWFGVLIIFKEKRDDMGCRQLGMGFRNHFLTKYVKLQHNFLLFRRKRSWGMVELLLNQKGMEVTGLSLKNKFLIGLSACL